VTTDVVMSADSHVIEPHDLWTEGVPERFRSRVPHLVREEETDRIVAEGLMMPPVGLLAGCARADDEVRLEGRWEEDVFRGGYDADERIRDMDRDGVAAEILYPTLGLQLYPQPDDDLLVAMLEAYNTWLAGFAARHPRRLYGVGMLLPERIDWSVQEVKRSVDAGLRGVMVPSIPPEGVSYWNEEFDPLWAAIEDSGLPLSMHASTSRLKPTNFDTRNPTDIVFYPVSAQYQFRDMIFSGLFERFPRLVVISAENDAGWLGHFLERMDSTYQRNYRMKPDVIRCKRPPSEIFRTNCAVTFTKEASAAVVAPLAGAEAIMWGSDYPHHSSTWPHSATVIETSVRRWSTPENAAKILCENVMRIYHLDQVDQPS